MPRACAMSTSSSCWHSHAHDCSWCTSDHVAQDSIAGVYRKYTGPLKKSDLDTDMQKDYNEAMEKAKKAHLNIWRYGDITQDDSREFGAPAPKPQR